MDGLRGCGGARCDGARVQADAGGRVQILQWMPALRSPILGVGYWNRGGMCYPCFERARFLGSGFGARLCAGYIVRDPLNELPFSTPLNRFY